MKKLLLLVFLTIILTTSLASAQCFSVKLSKGSYLSGETFQAEITGSLEKVITVDDLHFYEGNKEYFPAFDFEQIASDRWVVWTKTPTRYGDNKFTVTALCKDEILKEEIVTSKFLVQRPLQEAYSWLTSQVDERWPILNSDEVALTVLATGYDSRLHNNGRISLLSKSNLHVCWPSAPCNIKSTALALVALKGEVQEEQIKNWLLDSENKVDIGLWDLLISSNNAQTCNLTINNEKQELVLDEGFNLPIKLSLPDTPQILVSTTCSASSTKITHTYLGSVNEFPLLNNGTEYVTTLNNNQCWGDSYRSECTADATTYAIWALRELGESDFSEELNWLKQNLDTTIQRALYYSFTQDSEVESWLVNNQASEGYWSKKALAVSKTPDIISTVIASKHLSNIKGESWLKNIFELTGKFGSIEETTFAMNIFSSDSIEPLISSKGLIKARSGRNISIEFHNNGILPVNLTIKIFGKTKVLNIFPFSSKVLDIKATSYSKVTFREAQISYSNAFSGTKRGYSIPIIILPTGVVEAQVINETLAGNSLFPSKLEFNPKNITLRTDDEEFSFSVELKSSSEEKLLVGLSLFGISDILQSISPSSFELLPGESKIITVTFNTAGLLEQVVGSINAEAIGSSVSLPVSITPGKNKVGSEKTVDKDKGLDGDKKFYFPVNNKFIGWSMLILAVLLSAWFIYSKLKVKPEEKILKLSLDKVGLQSRR